MRESNVKGIALRMLLGAVLLSSSVLHAATFDILIDQDNNAVTGCTIATPDGPFPGVELIVSTTVNTAVYPPVVAGITMRDCSGASAVDTV